ncbi:transcriptional regulator [Latilactobacillus curvatus]|uniref:ArpU family phage packaging/lysis transcriptional regulator n=1 Tax=Latilactobacillus curvatus TaxID=28038 RepID=UPI001CBEC59E|nr:ArpU family phage packaging/lysis transcriptional regulator [Latilactobacillus curvatus]MBZ1504040.1 transcriptional regulator [Latilactobacillus curvatus]
MYKMDDLFPQVDEKATVNKVKHFLKHTLPQMQRYSHKDISGIKSPIITDMPKGSSVSNGAEEIITQRVYAGQVINSVVAALKSCDVVSRKLLIDVYVSSSKTPDYLEMEALGYEKTRYQFYKNRACLQFADSFMIEDLHVFKK